MPNLASAKKRMRQDIKRNAYNRAYMNKIRTMSKNVLQSIDNYDGDEDNLRLHLRQAQKVIDRAAAKGILKKKTMSRKNSRMNLKCKFALQKFQNDKS